MKSIALIGAKGYIGSALYKELQKNKNLLITPVTRQNYSKFKKKEFDIVINAAMPSGRFWAQQHPNEDFLETVQKTADIVYGWKYKKIIQISTISARSETETIYGKHKALAESLCDFGENLIVRLTATYGPTLKKGVLIDILNNNIVYVSGKSRYSFASLEFVCKWIAQNLAKKGIREVGAKNAVSLEKIAKSLKSSITFEGRLDTQEVQNPEPDFPDALEVLQYLQGKLDKKK